MSAVPTGLDAGTRYLREASEAWRPIDRAVARWVLAHGGPEALAVAAAWASFADGRGDAALMLAAPSACMPAWPERERVATAIQALADAPANGWVGRVNPDAAIPATPFALDGEAFYLRRNLLHEVAIGHALHARLNAPASALPALPEADLASWFDATPDRADQPQRQAVRQAAGRALFVLTGGPGTGKTTTVLRMLLAMAHAHLTAHGSMPSIRLAAPTGKAARRLAEALREGGRKLRERLDATAAQRMDALLEAPCDTVHGLLGASGDGRFGHHARAPLPADIVVVDEASMLDLALLHALLDALDEHTALVLVGDADQLASVDTGSVLADVVAALTDGPALVRLRHSFRSQRELAAINDAVRCGDTQSFGTAWNAAGAGAVRHALADERDLSQRLRAWSLRLRKTLSAAGAMDVHAAADAPSVTRALDGLKSCQLLCALREGPFGARAANAKLERLLGGAPEDAPGWFAGRTVVVLRNDGASGLANGDVGLCLCIADDQGESRLQVVFEPGGPPRADAAAGTPRVFDTDALPVHESAFALTIHKSQGSEYAHVAVLLPPQPGHPLLTRQLLYTALSRARLGVELWAEPAAVDACIARPLQRAGRLRARIAGA